MPHVVEAPDPTTGVEYLFTGQGYPESSIIAPLATGLRGAAVCSMDYWFGDWIRRRRKALDLTQEELAQRVGCSASFIFKIEADERRPSRQIAELLVAHLEISSDQRDRFLQVDVSV